MLRYLRAVQKMKQIIHDNKLTVMATNARYVSVTGATVAVATCPLPLRVLIPVRCLSLDR